MVFSKHRFHYINLVSTTCEWLKSSLIHVWLMDDFPLLKYCIFVGKSFSTTL